MMKQLEQQAAQALSHAEYVEGLTAPAHPLDALALAALDVALGLAYPQELLPGVEALRPLLTEDALDERPFRRRPATLARRFLMTKPKALDTPAARLVTRQVPTGGQMADRLALGLSRLRRRRIAGKYGAAPLAAALAHGRWSATPFRQSAATRLRDVLRHQVVFHPDPAPAPVLSPRLWWVLIDGHLPPEPQERQKDPLRAAIRAQSARAQAGERWLGFWEGYLLVSLGRAARQRLAPGLGPLRNGTAAALLDIDADSVRKNTALRLDWPETVPSYAASVVAEIAS